MARASSVVFSEGILGTKISEPCINSKLESTKFTPCSRVIQNRVMRTSVIGRLSAPSATRRWKKGATDKPHSHPVPFVVYPLDDCKIRVHNPDGSTQERESKAGTVFAGSITASHQAENVSANDCHAVFVERK